MTIVTESSYTVHVFKDFQTVHRQNVWCLDSRMCVP